MRRMWRYAASVVRPVANPGLRVLATLEAWKSRQKKGSDQQPPETSTTPSTSFSESSSPITTAGSGSPTTTTTTLTARALQRSLNLEDEEMYMLVVAARMRPELEHIKTRRYYLEKFAAVMQELKSECLFLVLFWFE